MGAAAGARATQAGGQGCGTVGVGSCGGPGTMAPSPGPPGRRGLPVRKLAGPTGRGCIRSAAGSVAHSSAYASARMRCWVRGSASSCVPQYPALFEVSATSAAWVASVAAGFSHNARPSTATPSSRMPASEGVGRRWLRQAGPHAAHPSRLARPAPHSPRLRRSRSLAAPSTPGVAGRSKASAVPTLMRRAEGIRKATSRMRGRAQSLQQRGRARSSA